MKPGDVVKRIWGQGELFSEMRVSAIDDNFIYCDAQRKNKDSPWTVLPPGSEHWKFDRVYGVETDESQGWGIGPGLRNIVLTRLEPE